MPSADSLLQLMVQSLPPKSSDETGSVVKTSYSAIGLFAHAYMTTAGFQLSGLGEDDWIGKTEHSADDGGLLRFLVVSPDSQEVSKLPAEWDAPATFAFQYTHPQSSQEYLMKVTRLGGKALINAAGLSDEKTASLEVKVQDFVSEGSIRESSSNPDRTTALRKIFVSDARIADLSSLFEANIIQKLVPGIHKESDDESTNTATTSREEPPPVEDRRRVEHDPSRDDEPEPAIPHPLMDLLAAPRRPVPHGDFPPPDFEDEYEMNRPPRGFPGPEGRRPLNIGERDLYPPGLGPHDPLRIGPGGGGYGTGGGMHPTFDDPLFAGPGSNPQQPDLRAPPGARYDPVGPGDLPPYGRGGPRFPGGRGGGGMGGNPFGGFGSGDFI